jgi:hypothetical protein
MTKKENSHRQRISHDFGRARGCCCGGGDAMACRLNGRFLMMVFCFVSFSAADWDGKANCAPCARPTLGASTATASTSLGSAFAMLIGVAFFATKVKHIFFYTSTVHCLSTLALLNHFACNTR